MSFVTHLECSETGKKYEAGKLYNLSEAGKPLLVRYDLKALAKTLSKEELASRHYGLWRYREFLPVEKDENCITLGEVISPIIRVPRILKKIGASGERRGEGRTNSYREVPRPRGRGRVGPKANIQERK